MRRVDQLITAARTISRNGANADGTFAISDNEILQYLNDAQDRLQNLISARKNIAKIFVTETIISIVGGQEAYTIPDRVLMNKQIESVEFSATGLASDYVPIEKMNFFNRNSNATNYPYGYFKRGGQIFLQALPQSSTGTLRVMYERDLDDLDIPRATIQSISGGTATQFTSLTLSTLADSYETTTPGWNNITTCCIVSSTGARKVRNLSFTYSSATNVLTPTTSPYVYQSGDVQLAVGDTLVFYPYTTTFSQLPDACERYLIHYAATELFHRDSSNDYGKEAAILKDMEGDIIAALMAQTSETQFVPQMNRYEWW